MASGASSAAKIMVFRPTMQDMGDFSAYISHMETHSAHKAGIAKVCACYALRIDYSLFVLVSHNDEYIVL